MTRYPLGVRARVAAGREAVRCLKLIDRDPGDPDSLNTDLVGAEPELTARKLTRPSKTGR